MSFSICAGLAALAVTHQLASTDSLSCEAGLAQYERLRSLICSILAAGYRTPGVIVFLDSLVAL